MRKQKGVNQIDFALALSVMVVVIAFSISYVTSYFSRVSPDSRTSGLQSAADGIGKILFESAGIPPSWESNNYLPVRAGLKGGADRIAITAAEKGGANHSFEEADIHVVFDRSCANTTYNNSIRVYDQFMNDTAFRIYNYTECAANSGFLREANINFLFNLTGNTSQIFWLYYTNNTATPKKPTYNFSYDPSLVGYWKLDSVNASNYTPDSTNYHNDGRLFNYSCDPAACNITGGQIFSGLVFDGADDYANITNPNGLYTPVEVTVGAWARTAKTSSETKTIYSRGESYILGISPENSLYFRARNTTSSILSADGLIPAVNQWYHIVGVYNGSYIKLYVNGSFVAQIYLGGNIRDSSVDRNYHIGAKYAWHTGNSYYDDYFWNGTIDEVRIYNRSLSADEIRALYNYTSPKYVVSSSAAPAVTHKKISAFQNLSYSDAKNSLGLKNNFNLTICEYSIGRNVPDTANMIASAYPTIVINSTGSVKPCMAGVNVW